jgi:AbrB family looped-hinge helix DNA binding protein
MPRVTSKGQVTIPKAIREELGIEPGDEIRFERTQEGYSIRKKAPTTADGDDPFEQYRGWADDDASMPERMRRLRTEYPRRTGAEDGDDGSATT